MKKGEIELGLNVIIIAAIALLVLIILVVLVVLILRAGQEAKEDPVLKEFEQEKFKCYRATDSKLGCREGCLKMYQYLGDVINNLDESGLSVKCNEWCQEYYACEDE